MPFEVRISKKVLGAWRIGACERASISVGAKMLFQPGRTIECLRAVRISAREMIDTAWPNPRRCFRG